MTMKYSLILLLTALLLFACDQTVNPSKTQDPPPKDTLHFDFEGEWTVDFYHDLSLPRDSSYTVTLTAAADSMLVWKSKRMLINFKFFGYFDPYSSSLLFVTDEWGLDISSYSDYSFEATMYNYIINFPNIYNYLIGFR